MFFSLYLFSLGRLGSSNIYAYPYFIDVDDLEVKETIVDATMSVLLMRNVITFTNKLPQRTNRVMDIRERTRISKDSSINELVDIFDLFTLFTRLKAKNPMNSGDVNQHDSLSSTEAPANEEPTLQDRNIPLYQLQNKSRTTALETKIWKTYSGP
jgi:hypothetical protein